MRNLDVVYILKSDDRYKIEGLKKQTYEELVLLKVRIEWSKKSKNESEKRI